MNQNNIDEVIKRIQNKWGYSAIQTAKKLKLKPPTLPTGFLALDDLMVGLPQSHVTEIAGQPTSGMSSLSYSFMAAAQKSGEHVVYVDMDTTFDGAMGRNFGIDIDELVLVEETDEAVLLDVLRAIVRSGVVGLVVINLLPIKTYFLDLQRLMSDIHHSQSALVCLMQPYTKTNSASLRLHVERQKWLRNQGDVVGCLSRVTVARIASAERAIAPCC